MNTDVTEMEKNVSNYTGNHMEGEEDSGICSSLENPATKDYQLDFEETSSPARHASSLYRIPKEKKLRRKKKIVIEFF